MKSNSIFINGQSYIWSSQQISQHPDFVLLSAKGKIWVSVTDSYDEKQCFLYSKEKAEFPVSSKTAEVIITQIIKSGYLESYFVNTDIGLTLSDTGILEEC